MIEQTKFTYFPSENTLEKQAKTIEDEGSKQIDGFMSQNKI